VNLCLLMFCGHWHPPEWTKLALKAQTLWEGSLLRAYKSWKDGLHEILYAVNILPPQLYAVNFYRTFSTKQWAKNCWPRCCNCFVFRGVTKVGKGGRIPRAPNHYGAPNNCGEHRMTAWVAEKSQQCHKVLTSIQ